MKNLPYAQQVGTLENMLEKIITASVPEKFSPDFVSTVLKMKGGSARSTIPFIKKMGFVASDGTPTERYSKFRNSEKSGSAIAKAMREIYSRLFEMNEYVYRLDGNALKNIIVEATGAEATSTSVVKTVATFKALNKIADFGVQDNKPATVKKQPSGTIPDDPVQINSLIAHNDSTGSSESINLSYTINLNLPPTTDIEVFNAIFKSLKEHLLQD